MHDIVSHAEQQRNPFASGWVLPREAPKTKGGEVQAQQTFQQSAASLHSCRSLPTPILNPVFQPPCAPSPPTLAPAAPPPCVPEVGRKCPDSTERLKQAYAQAQSLAQSRGFSQSPMADMVSRHEETCLSLEPKSLSSLLNLMVAPSMEAMDCSTLSSQLRHPDQWLEKTHDIQHVTRVVPMQGCSHREGVPTSYQERFHEDICERSEKTRMLAQVGGVGSPTKMLLASALHNAAGAPGTLVRRCPPKKVASSMDDESISTAGGSSRSHTEAPASERYGGSSSSASSCCGSSCASSRASAIEKTTNEQRRDEQKLRVVPRLDESKDLDLLRRSSSNEFESSADPHVAPSAVVAACSKQPAAGDANMISKGKKSSAAHQGQRELRTLQNSHRSRARDRDGHRLIDSREEDQESAVPSSESLCTSCEEALQDLDNQKTVHASVCTNQHHSQKLETRRSKADTKKNLQDHSSHVRSRLHPKKAIQMTQKAPESQVCTSDNRMVESKSTPSRSSSCPIDGIRGDSGANIVHNGQTPRTIPFSSNRACNSAKGGNARPDTQSASVQLVCALAAMEIMAPEDHELTDVERMFLSRTFDRGSDSSKISSTHGDNYTPKLGATDIAGEEPQAPEFLWTPSCGQEHRHAAQMAQMENMPAVVKHRELVPEDHSTLCSPIPAVSICENSMCTDGAQSLTFADKLRLLSKEQNSTAVLETIAQKPNDANDSLYIQDRCGSGLRQRHRRRRSLSACRRVSEMVEDEARCASEENRMMVEKSVCPSASSRCHWSSTAPCEHLAYKKEEAPVKHNRAWWDEDEPLPFYEEEHALPDRCEMRPRRRRRSLKRAGVSPKAGLSNNHPNAISEDVGQPCFTASSNDVQTLQETTVTSIDTPLAPFPPKPSSSSSRITLIDTPTATIPPKPSPSASSDNEEHDYWQSAIAWSPAEVSESRRLSSKCGNNTRLRRSSSNIQPAPARSTGARKSIQASCNGPIVLGNPIDNGSRS